MGNSLRKAIIRGAENGMNIVELALCFTCHKDKVTHQQYLAFCSWAKKNESFYYWLRRRLNPAYKLA